MINVEQYSKKGFQLNTEAEQIVEKGSHEALIYNAIPEEGIPQTELMVTKNKKLLNNTKKKNY